MTRAWERQHLLGQLQSSWAAVSDGAVRIHMVRGEPGMGKSSLLAELQHRIGENARLVRGYGRDDDRPLRVAVEAARPHRLTASLDTLTAARALARAWARRTRSAPLALLIDDVHEIDPASRTALGIALRSFEGQALLVVATGRPVPDFARFAEGFDLSDLAGLSAADARRLVQNSSPHVAHEAVIDRLVALAAGNPLAAGSLPRSLTAQQLAGEHPLPEPMVLGGDLRNLLTRPLRDVSEAARELLELAMLSLDGDWATVRAAAGDSAAVVAELESSGLVALHGGRVEPFHPLLRDAVRGELDPPRRRQLAQRLARVPGLTAQKRLSYRALATVGHDPELARELAQAAEEVNRRRSADAAALLFERAADAAAPDGEGIAMSLRAAEALALVGETARARARLVRLLGSEVSTLTDEQHVQAETMLAALESIAGDAARARARLEELLDRAPASGRASVLGALSIPLGMMGDIPALLETTERALDEPSATPGVTGALRVVRAHALSSVDEGAGADLLADVLPSLDVRAAVRADPLFGLHVGRAFGFAERYAEGARLMTALIAGARRLGARTTLAMAHGALADIRLRSSRLDDSSVHLDDAIALSLGSGQRAFAPFWLGMRARIAGYRGEFEAAAADLALGYDIADDVGGEGTRYYLDAHAGVVAATAEDWGAAAECLERVRHFERAQGGLSPQVARWSVDLVDAYGALGAGRARDELIVDLQRAAQKPGARRWTRATALIATAVAALDDDPRRAATVAAEAARALRADDDRLDRVRARMVHVRALHSIGATRDDVREIAAETRHGLAALRLRPWESRLDRSLGVAPGGVTLAEQRRSVLTSAELRVLDAVARGLSNQQIAARLGISVKTVANHLYRIYGKLGVTSRTEAARRHLLGE